MSPGPGDILPARFPRPPLPGIFFREEEEDEPGEGTNGGEPALDSEFRARMGHEGFDPDLIEMGLKVAKNHMRPSEEAFRIGENYIREMAK